MNGANPMLTWYARAVIDALPGRLILDPKREARAGDLTFRDAEGRWWRPQRSGQWLRHDGEAWLAADPPDSLEGATPLPVGAAAVQPAAAAEGGAGEPAEAPAPEGLRRGIDHIRRAYRSGEMVSTMAELLLANWMLLTQDGGVWTVGAQSQDWYAYGNQGWERRSGPPAGPFVGRAEATAAGPAGSPFRVWADRGPYLPESVTPSWLPPDPPGPHSLPIAAAGPVRPGWTATHLTPASGLPGWGEPDGSAPKVAAFAGGAPLQVMEQRADWALVRGADGTEAWVDGRRLVSIAEVPPPPPPPDENAALAPEAAASASAVPARSGVILLIAAVALLVSAFLPWRAGGWPSPFRVSATFLWDVEAELGGFSVGLVVLLLGVAVLATLFVPRLQRYRRLVGGVVCAVAALWLIETFRYVWGYAYLGWGFLGEVFTVGPRLALGAGLVLVLKRR